MSEEQSPFEEQPASSVREAQIQAALRRQRFYDTVMKVIEGLPEGLRSRLENVDVVAADWPTPSQLGRNNVRSRFALLGLYEGVPHTRRGRGYGMVLPDKITIFRKPIEARCRYWSDVEKEIGRVVRHEIAHHFGFDEQTLRDIEGGKPDK